MGDFPQCPHARVGGDPYKAEYFQDEIPGGMVLEHGFAEPIRVNSWSEMEALYAKNDLKLLEKHCPTPGTDTDPSGVQDYRKYRDAKTLANGAALILRQAKADEVNGVPFDIDAVFKLNDEGGPTSIAETDDYELCQECKGECRISYAVAKGLPQYQDSIVYRLNGAYVVDCLGCDGSGFQEVKRAEHRERKDIMDA